VLNNVLSKNRTVFGHNVEHYGTSRQSRYDITIWCMHIAC